MHWKRKLTAVEQRVSELGPDQHCRVCGYSGQVARIAIAAHGRWPFASCIRCRRRLSPDLRPMAGVAKVIVMADGATEDGAPLFRKHASTDDRSYEPTYPIEAPAGVSLQPPA